MSLTHRTSAHPFPPPHRAPDFLDELSSPPADDDALAAGDPGQRRHQRAMDGWMATRIRKQARHWRLR